MEVYKCGALSYNDKALDELQDATSLVNALLTCCKDKEFKGEYYGIPFDFTQMLSNERNEYLSLLSIAADKLYNLKHLHLCIERELSLLQENSDDCSRQITTQRTAD